MSILDDAKIAVKFVQEIGNVELLQRIVNLQSEIVELVQERNDLKTKIQDFEERQKQKETLEFRDNMYWEKESNAKTDGPFCSGCFDGSGKTVRLQHLEGVSDFYYHCPICGIDISK